jgi:ATP-NAD kinase N-terminal domain
MSGLHLGSSSLRYRNLLVVIKQTAFEEYSQLKLRGQAPKALRWKRLEQRYRAHKQCVNDLLSVLRKHDVSFSCVNRVELDRQHLADVDLMVAVGGDGTVLSAAHFLDHGTIPLLGINSDPNVSMEDRKVTKKVVDERRCVSCRCLRESGMWNAGGFAVAFPLPRGLRHRRSYIYLHSLAPLQIDDVFRQLAFANIDACIML